MNNRIFGKVAEVLIILAVLAFGLHFFKPQANAIIEEIESKIYGSTDTIVIEHPIVIDSVKGQKDLHICHASIEEMFQETKRDTVKVLGQSLSTSKHSRVQIVGQKCSYKIAMQDVKYLIVDSLMTIYVSLPEIQYDTLTYMSKYITDDSDYWTEYEHHLLQRKVKKKIEARFQTKENRKKAKALAVYEVSRILRELVGTKYQIVVEQNLERHLE